MDNTEIFRELITSQIRNKNISNPPTRPPLTTTSFAQHANQLRTRLSSMESFLSRISRSYLLVRLLFLSEIPFLSDTERSIIDDNLERQLHESSRWLDQLKEEVKKDRGSDAQVREHNQIVVVSLLARLSQLSQKVSRLQTAHYEAVLLSQSPFTTWLSTPKSDSFVEVYPSSCVTASSEQSHPMPHRVPSRLLNAITTTTTISDAQLKVDRVRGRGAMNIEDWAYALLLVAAHTHLMCPQSETASDAGLSSLGSAAGRLLSQEDEFTCKTEWERVVSAAIGCWNWTELRSKLQEENDQFDENKRMLQAMYPYSQDMSIPQEKGLDQEDEDEIEFQAYLKEVLPEKQSTVEVQELPLSLRSTDPLLLVTQLKKTRPPLLQPQSPSISTERRNASRSAIQQQQQIMEAEHESLGVELAGELDAVLKTEMKMREVSEIMALFSDKVAAQTEDVEAIFDTTESVVEDVDAGHEQLISASKRRRVARHIYVTITLVLSFIILFMDMLF